MNQTAASPGIRTSAGESREHNASRLADIPGLAKWVMFPNLTLSTGATAVFSNTAPPPRLSNLIPRIAPRPIFLIWTVAGPGGETINPAYYQAAGEPKAAWEIPEAGHTGGITARPIEYDQRVIAFFDNAPLRTT